MKIPELRPRAPMAGLAIAAAVGVALADHWATPPLWDLVGLVVLAILLVRRPTTIACWLWVAAAFFILHAARSGSEARMLSDLFTNGPRVVRIVGVVSDEPQKPKKWSQYTTCHFPLQLESIEIGGASVLSSACLQIHWNGPAPEYGDRVSVLGSASNLTPPRNPGEFDNAEYQRRHGFYDEVRARYAADCKILEHDRGSLIWKTALACREWIRQQLTRDLEDSPQVSGLVTSLVLGMRNDTPDDLRALFQETGTVHLFAVSGLTVAMLTLFLVQLTKMLGIPRGLSVICIVLLLCGYAFVTGLATSTVRATIMASVLLAGTLFDRPAVTYNSFGAAALLILCFDTNQLFLTGFQFSFGVVFFVIWLTDKVKRRIDPLGQPDSFLPRTLWTRSQRAQSWVWGKVSEGVSVSLVAWIGSLPFSAGYFHLFSPGSVIANLLAVPLSFVVLGLGTASALAALISPMLAVLINNANWLAAQMLLWVLQTFAQLPCSYAYVGRMEYPIRHRCEVTALDVGAGGAIHIRTDSKDWLIDCGHGYEYDHIVLPYLRSRGVNRLDGLILTVGNVQHIGGAISTLTDLRPEVIAESPLKDRSTARRDFNKALADRNLGKRIVQGGDIIRLSPGASLQMLYPPVGIQRPSAEDKALVMMLRTEGTRILFMSSSGYFTEQWLLQNGADIRADILVKAQHSKDLSATPDFIARVHPQVIVCPAPPRVSAQDSETRDVLPAKADIETFRQDQTGAVSIILHDREIRIDGFLNHQTFFSRAR